MNLLALTRVALVAALLVTTSAALAQEDEEAFTVERYQALEQELEELDLARVAAPPGSDERAAATEAAIDHRRELMNYITGWIRAGTLPPEAVDQAREARLILVENIVQLSVEVGLCDDARASLSLIRGFSQGDTGRQAAYDAAVDAVEACVPAEDPVVLGPDPPSEDPIVVVPPEDPPENDPPVQSPPEEPPYAGSPARRADPIGVSLMAAGGVAAISGTAWNLALLDDRAAYLDDRRACESTGADCGAARDARSRLHSAKAPITGLVVGGVALTAVGAILQWRTSDRADAAVQVRPAAGGLRVSFGRGTP